MKNLSFPSLLSLVMLFFCLISCEQAPAADPPGPNAQEQKQAFETVMTKHLQAVSDKNLVALKSTMSPRGDMQLILPGAEIMVSVDSFMHFHETWFQDTSWTFETEILNTTVGDKVGMAITEIIYREPERDGVPYFNRMIVSYDLENIDGQWYVIKDHATSVEKSTD